jgi:hypothetical protein
VVLFLNLAQVQVSVNIEYLLIVLYFPICLYSIHARWFSSGYWCLHSVVLSECDYSVNSEHMFSDTYAVFSCCYKFTSDNQLMECYAVLQFFCDIC